MYEYCFLCGSILVCNEWEGCGTKCECNIKRCNNCNATFSHEEIYIVICNLIEMMLRAHESKSDDSILRMGFCAITLPNISLCEYIRRLCDHMLCSKECYAIALLYIVRAIEKRSIKINLFNIHRIFLSALVVAIKFHDDTFRSNKYYADVGGISNREMNELELAFLNLIDYEGWVSSKCIGSCNKILQ